MGSFIESQIKKGAEFKKVITPLETLKWLHMVHYSFPYLNIDYYGLGADSNEKLAYIKAVVEFYERKAFFDIGIIRGFSSTNGIAGHRFHFLAQKAAIAEIYERDSFLCHWYSQIPFLKIVNEDSKIELVIKELSDLKIKTLFRITFLGHQKTVACFLVNEETGGFALGLSNNQFDLFKAFSEAIINYFLGNQGENSSELLSDLHEKGLSSLKNHRTYWLHENVIPEWILNDFSDLSIEVPKLLSPKVMNHFNSKTGPICISGVQLSEVFTLKMGFPCKDDIDLLRLKTGRDMTEQYNNNEVIPHPIP